MNTLLWRSVSVGLFLLLMGLTACTGTPAATGPTDGQLVLDLVPGPSYQTTTRWLIFDFPVYPQVAAWVETLDGQYIETLYVTGKSASNCWVSAPEAGRPEALPVWGHLPKAKVDQVASATPTGPVEVGMSPVRPLASGTYTVYLEVNRSYDYNARYTRENSGVNGQPSVVYKAVVTLGQGPRAVDFIPVGTGSTLGEDGMIHPDLSGIDTAYQLFSRLNVTVDK